MSRLTSIKRLGVATLATIGVVAACRAARPSEAPPLAPKPEIGRPTSPVPGAPDPIDPDPCKPGWDTPAPDAGPVPKPVTQLAPPVVRSSVELQAPRDGGPDATLADDAGRNDAATDGGTDAGTDATLDAASDAPADASDGVGLPPDPDASPPSDTVRPLL